jgi:methionyl-tRNA formyltransferase
MPATAVVFAYSEVGARCLTALLTAGIDVRLVVTHEDDPKEERWFASVAEVAAGAGVRFITPADPAAPEPLADIAQAQPDFIFSFYYRRMLPENILSLARRGALNMHGSLLPKFRGRAPVNWAVLMGETETGASLHYMEAKPDAGALVDQERVLIGPDDTGFEVAGRVAEAAVTCLTRALPDLVAGTARATPMDLRQGSYYGGRKPADGEISLHWPAKRVHDLVRAVAPPFPSAFLRLGDVIISVHRTRHLHSVSATGCEATLAVDGNRLVATCGDGGCLEVVAAVIDGHALDADRFRKIFGCDRVSASPLGSSALESS